MSGAFVSMTRANLDDPTVIRRRDEENLGHETFRLRVLVSGAALRIAAARGVACETIDERGAFLPGSLLYSSGRRLSVTFVGVSASRRENTHFFSVLLRKKPINQLYRSVFDVVASPARQLLTVAAAGGPLPARPLHRMEDMRNLSGSAEFARSICTGIASVCRSLRATQRDFMREGKREWPNALRGLLAVLILVVPAPMVSGSVPEAPLGAPAIAHGVGDLAQLQGAGAGWMGRIQHHLAAREYAAGTNLRGLQAPNRAHNLRTYLDATGIQIVDRTAVSSP
ncbi:MAG: hypothetical protein JRE57_10070, partial [Deltaproteobacteria bacterium]|nr:hypothetical protein [Deltaproteobacteria bacterium]